MIDRRELPGVSKANDSDFRDMLRQVRQVDPGANPDNVRRYAREIAEADAALRTLDLDPIAAPLETPFAPEWPTESSE